MTSIERVRTSVAAVACALAFATSTRADVVPDDARESRWADQVATQIVVGDAVWLATPHRPKVLALYATPSAPAPGAVIVVHGLGVHPDWNLIGEIRSGLVDRGYATLSVQMPVLAADAPRDDYAGLNRFAAERLDAAVAWLRAQGHGRIAVVAHSMGAAMVDSWIARTPRIDAWIPIGMLVPFSMKPALPVLDVIGERDYPEVLRRRGAEGQAFLPQDGCSAAVTITGADHFMSGAVPRLLERMSPFLARAFAQECRRP